MNKHVKFLLLSGIITLTSATASIAKDAFTAFTGRVFLDRNMNSLCDVTEYGLPGIAVSNGIDIATTDDAGYYQLPLTDESFLFVIKPSQYNLPVDRNNLPMFYHRLSPESLSSTETDAQASLDFALLEGTPKDSFSAIIIADPQVRTDAELSYLRDDVFAEIALANVDFTLTLGDIVNDNLALLPRYISLQARIGKPSYFVPGNHDIDFSATNDLASLNTYKRFFGPRYYSFNYGRVHFIVLDSVEYRGNRQYAGTIGEQQLKWLKNDLSLVPQENLVVLSMHIPLFSAVDAPGTKHHVKDSARLSEALSGRSNLLILAGHTHTLEHHFLSEEVGWTGSKPLNQLICATGSGYWWGGPKDERGIPITEQRDGTPNGYHILKVDGLTYTQRFKVASKSEDYQIRITPTKDSIVANVFDGSSLSKVSCLLDDLSWVDMTHTPMVDPFIRDLFFGGSYEDAWPVESQHVWTMPLPKSLAPGPHRVTVMSEDRFGQTSESCLIFETN